MLDYLQFLREEMALVDQEGLLGPLEASEMTMLGAGFTISLSSFAITYLLWPRRRWAVTRPETVSECAESLNLGEPMERS